MVNINIIEARIKRNKLEILAGEFYQNTNSLFIKDLQVQGFSALVGIKRKDDVYTVIGNNETYFCSNSGVKGQISHHDFLNILHINALNKSKKGKFEFVEISEGCSIWVLNIQVMYAMWNTILLLHQ